MKRLLLAGAIAASALLCIATAEDAADVAEKVNAEERYSKLRAAVEDILATQALVQKRIAALADEVQALREEGLKSAGRHPTYDDLAKLAGQLQEVDRKREEDKKLILEEIKKLASIPLPEAPKPKPPPEQPAAEVPRKGYEYEVKRGDTLAEIVAAYKKKGVKVTAPMVLKANPGLKEKSLKIGQKVFIPDPDAK